MTIWMSKLRGFGSFCRGWPGLCLAAMVLNGPRLDAQAAYTATRPTRIQVGVGGLLLDNDYLSRYDKGVTVYGSYDFLRFAGLEADLHFGTIVVPESVGENSYLAGPRFTVHVRKATIYGKVLIGRGTITNQRYQATAGFNAFAYGGGVEYRATRKLNVRAFDVELEKWPNFESHTLSPIAMTVGIAYLIR